MDNYWKDAEVISRYTRAQAIEDGFLDDMSTLAREAGFTYPVAFSAGVMAACVTIPEGVTGQDHQGRAWDVLSVLRFAIKAARSGSDRVTFSVMVRNHNRARLTGADKVELYAVVGGGDNGEPVITVMLPNED